MLNISIVQIIVILAIRCCLYSARQMAWQKKQSQT